MYFTVKYVIGMQIPSEKKTLMHIKIEIFSKDIRKCHECDRCHTKLDIWSIQFM